MVVLLIFMMWFLLQVIQDYHLILVVLLLLVVDTCFLLTWQMMDPLYIAVQKLPTEVCVELLTISFNLVTMKF